MGNITTNPMVQPNPMPLNTTASMVSTTALDNEDRKSVADHLKEIERHLKSVMEWFHENMGQHVDLAEHAQHGRAAKKEIINGDAQTEGTPRKMYAQIERRL